MKFGTLQVYPRQGVLKEYGLDLPSAILGRGEGTQIFIDDFSISRRHARLTIDSGRLLIEDLGSVGGTYVDGVKLEPGVRHLVAPDATLRFGDIEAKYIDAESVDLAARGAGAEAAAPVEEAKFGIALTLTSPAIPVDPGKSVSATLTIVNRGRLVDTVQLQVSDLPRDWYSLERSEISLLPGERVDVPLALHPPRNADSLAGEYAFTVTVTSREYEDSAEAEGSFDVHPFEAVSLSFAAVRSKRKFTVIAENKGNDAVHYDLEGRDDEQAFAYAFEVPSVDIQPGQKTTVGLTVTKKPQWFGQSIPIPFQVIGHSASGAEVTARGQLANNPPLQKFKMPALYMVAALVLLATLATVLIVTDSGTKKASAEDPYAGVHLCDDANAKAKQEQKNAQAAQAQPISNATVVGPADAGRPLFGEVDKNGAPFFAQNDPRWGTQEYARSTELPNGRDWCGTTIEQCGCAMTSVSVMLALYGLLNMPDGQPLSPKSLNDWFNGNARKTERGWVSRGYIYGDVIWSAANELSGEIAKVNPNVRTVRFVSTGSGSEDEIKAELKAGRPVVLEVPGHWIAAVGLDGDQILINDPFYRDRKTLDVYAGKVRSSVHFEPSTDLSAVVITAPADVKFRITDKEGRVVATSTGTELSASGAVNQIPGASVSTKKAWRDPTCIEKAPPSDAGTNQITLPGGKDDYKVEIIGTGDQPGAVDIHTYAKDGKSTISTIEGQEGTKADVSYDPNADKPVINITNNGIQQPTSTPQPGGGGGGPNDEETPTPGPPALTPTATSTPFVEQRTAMTLPAEPGQTRVEVATNSGFELGDPIRFAPGLPNEEDNIIVGFGSFILATPLKFAHSPGEPIQRLQRPPGQGPGLPPGITPPPATGPIEPPKDIVMACSTIYQASPKLATFICDLQVTGDFTTTRWSLNGKVITDFSGATSFVMTFPGDTPAAISATVCNQTLCRSTSRVDRVEFPPSGSGISPGNAGAGGTGSGGGATPTPAAAAVTVTCGTKFDQTVSPAVANIACEANFAGDFTGVSWSAPGASPPSASGAKKTFATKLINDLGSPSTVKISATVCNFGVCRTSNPITVGVGHTKTVIDSEPRDSVHQRQTVTLFAAVVGLNGIVPQGGNVQFYADDSPINPSAALFTVGSTSVAQISFPTGTDQGLKDPGTHHIYAVYSGGINAFGSTSLVGDLVVLPPLPDACDSVDEDRNGVTDDFTTGSGDPSCDITVPRNLGSGTVLQSLNISTGNAADQDGAPNAVVVRPGQPVSISGSVGRTDYCPGCIRQVYFGIGGYDSQATPTKIGPACKYSGGTPLTPAAFPSGVWTVNAPTTPGVYYVRATTTLDYFCVGPSVGPPDRSVGRIVVQGPVVADVKLFDVASDTDANPWDDDLTTAPTVSTVAAGKKLIVRAKVPAGATGRVDISGVGGTALSAPVCPPSGQLTIPSIQATPIACTPGEARVMSPAITDDTTVMFVRGRFANPFPAKLTSPASGNPIDYPFYQSPDQVDPGPFEDPEVPGGHHWTGSNVVRVKVLVTPSITVSANPNPVQMGQSFTLTATVAPQTPPTTGSATAIGGKIQFWAGGNKIGGQIDVALVGVNEQASITWTPRDCGGTKPACSGANEGFPFDSRDDNSGAGRPYYNDVHAEYISGGNADLKSGTSSNINVDIDPTTSATTITNVSVTTLTVGDSFTITTTVVATGFNPAPGVVTVRAGTSTLTTHTLTDAECPATAGVYTCTFTTASISTGGDTDVIDTPGTYSLTSAFGGSSQVDSSTSAAVTLTVSLASPTLTLCAPNPDCGTITVGDTGNLRAVLTGTPANRLDDNSATVSLRNNGTQIAQANVPNVGSGSINIDFPVSGLNAGSYNLTVVYSGNNYFSGKTEPSTGSTTFTVNPYAPAITLNPITAVPVGNSLFVSATVSCGGGACTGVRSTSGGSVSFYKDSVAPANLLDTTSTISPGGTATITYATGGTSLLPAAGTAYTILAEFNGDASPDNLTVATSSTGTVTLSKRNATVTVQNQTANLGETVTFTATVASGSGAVSPDCSACVQFKVGPSLSSATDLGTPQSVVSGTTSLANVTTGTGTFAANGRYVIWAVYAGNSNVNSQTDSGDLQLASPVTLTVSAPSPVIVGTATTLTATVAPSNAPGTVQFKVNGTNFGSPQTLSSGSATISWTPSSTGNFDITASYTSSSGGFLSDPDSNTVTVVVDPRPVTVTISAGSSVTLGNSITLTATLSPANAPGTVRFFADGVEISGVGGVPAHTSDGITTFSWSPTSVGDGVATISATYTSSSTNFASQPTSTNDDVTVNPAATTTVAIGTQTGGAGSSITLRVDVTSTFGVKGDIDGGTVTWTITAGAGTCTGLATATVTDGVATLTGVTCPAGNNYNVRGSYTGSGNYAGSADTSDYDLDVS